MREAFVFFNITSVHGFKTKLGGEIYQRITTAAQLADPVKQPMVAVNIAFSAKGLQVLEVTDDLGDPNFKTGQGNDAVMLGDPGTTKWHDSYQKGVHGVLQVAGMQKMIDEEVKNIKAIFGDAFQEVYRLDAFARPGAGKGHERE